MRLPKYAAALAILLAIGCANRRYPEEARYRFIHACMNGGGDLASCTCTLERVEKEYSYEEYVNIELDMKEGKRPPKKLEMCAVSCALEN